jgi:hypothetical protein
MDDPVYGIIYLLEFPNGKYIGQTIQGLNVRFWQHTKDARNGSTLPVHRAILKYKDTNEIKKTVLKVAYSKEELDSLETQCIIEYNTLHSKENPCGYNLTLGGEGPRGYKFTDDQREAVRQEQKRRKEEEPEIYERQSKTMKKKYEENPELALEHSEKMKTLYKAHPEKKTAMSELKKKQNQENPEMAEFQRKNKNEIYADELRGPIIKEKIRQAAIAQWQDPVLKQKMVESYRRRFAKKFNVYKDGVFVAEFDMIPDCSIALFGTKTQAANINAVLKGKRKVCQGHTFQYCD